MKDFLHFARVIHGKIHERMSEQFLAFELFFQRLRNPKAVFLILTPQHGNLGDHAIATSEADLLNALKIPYIEVTGRHLQILNKCGHLNVMNGCTILINGGGNLGTLWIGVERLIRSVIQNNPKSKILVFPSTIFYENSPEGEEELRKSVSIYGAHQNLFLYAREPISFDVMQKLYGNVRLAPDMVLRLDKSDPKRVREGCVLCLRSDLEKTLSQRENDIIISSAKEMFGDHLRFLDMVQGNNISIANRSVELEKQFDSFRNAELVITDRLHGMIFSAVTGTPCIVVKSKSPKVLGCGEWVKNLPYIRYCENLSDIRHIYESIPKQDWKYDPKKLMPLYKQLTDELIQITKGSPYGNC